MFPRASYVPTSVLCFHERRMFPRAELVATTFNRDGLFLLMNRFFPRAELVATTFDRGRFLSLWLLHFKFQVPA
ncbi:MAG: hypothetical protein ACI80P_001558 [Flavobacteriales bacterium]|jgi:hypothetical protein